jgi:RNA polymerase sigma factor (sigma-70 family)
MVGQDIEEIELINSAVQNISDNKAWRYIYNRYYGAVKQILFQCGFIGQDAKDLAQQTFVKILNAKKKPKFDNIPSFYVWLKRAVLSVVKDTVKSRAGSEAQQTEYLGDVKELDIVVPSDSVLDTAISIKVNNALARMPERDRKLLVLRANGTAYQVITAETGIPINNIRVYYQRAVKKFKEFLLIEGVIK